MEFLGPQTQASNLTLSVGEERLSNKNVRCLKEYRTSSKERKNCRFSHHQEDGLSEVIPYEYDGMPLHGRIKQIYHAGLVGRGILSDGRGCFEKKTKKEVNDARGVIVVRKASQMLRLISRTA